MFHGKIYSYQNINGQEKSFEKTFDNHDEFQNFMNEHSGFHELSSPSSLFDAMFDGMLSRRLSSRTQEEQKSLPINISKYEDEARKIDMDEKQKERRRKQLEEAKTQLEQYKSKFEQSGKKDLIKDLEKDMKTIEDELKDIGTSNTKKDSKQKEAV